MATLDELLARRSAKGGGGVGVPQQVTGPATLPAVPPSAPAPPWPAPCPTPAPIDLFGDPPAFPPTCGCRHFWEDAYGRRRCGVCSPPPSAALIRKLWYVAGGPGQFSAVELPRVGAAGLTGKSGGGVSPDPVETGGDGGSGPDAASGLPTGSIFFGDPSAKLRLRCQQQPGENIWAWWDRSQEATDGMFSVIEATRAGRLSRKPPAALDVAPPIPKGREAFYLARVGGGVGLRLIVGEKAAAKHRKAITAMTWAGAGRWWALKGGEEAEESTEASGRVAGSRGTRAAAGDAGEDSDSADSQLSFSEPDDSD